MHETTVSIPEDAGINVVEELKGKLLASLGKASSGGSILIDTSKLRSADSSFAQLLLSFKEESAARDVLVAITGRKDELSIKSLLCCDSMDEALSDAVIMLESGVQPAKGGSQ